MSSRFAIDTERKPSERSSTRYMTLPETTVIAFGNNRYDYKNYKSSLNTQRPRKEERSMTNLRKLSPHFLKPRLSDRAFKVHLTFPELEHESSNKVPVVKDRILVRVEIPDKDRLIRHR